MTQLINLKKISLCIILLSTFSVEITHANAYRNWHSFFDALGSVADLLLSRGKLSDKHEKMFDEIAKRLGIECHKIKIRNSGLLTRLFFGYTHTRHMNNSIHINEDFFKELNDEQKQCFMAHELIHLRRNHRLLLLFFGSYIFNLQKNIIYSRDTPLDADPITQRLKWASLLSLISISYLIDAQFFQYEELAADAETIDIVDTENMIALLRSLYYPNTDAWPFYAKLQQAFRSLYDIIRSLPIIKQHSYYCSFNERAEHLRNLSSNKN